MTELETEVVEAVLRVIRNGSAEERSALITTIGEFDQHIALRQREEAPAHHASRRGQLDIDVDAFLARDDIPPEVKARVREIGRLALRNANPTYGERLMAYQLMRERIIIEVKIASDLLA